ncbi:MAG: hypothetical protein SGJ13_14170 [Actinomycetota bacterium]|nr:hypothetical protein [Actinomycetota bacterium]
MSAPKTVLVTGATGNGATSRRRRVSEMPRPTRVSNRSCIAAGSAGSAGSATKPPKTCRRISPAGAVPVTELRAALVIGSGSASFEMLRNLVEVLPAMVTPRWVRTRAQPIAIGDVLAYISPACSSIRGRRAESSRSAVPLSSRTQT